MKIVNYSDSDSRKMISKDIYTNLFVEASAGSGKTTSLVNRMVALVEKGIPVNQICTITFTVAAADEFFERFQDLLSRRTIDNPDDPSVNDLGPTTIKSREYCLEALNNIDSCFNGTMDSFCNMVAHELPNELDIPSDAKVISNDEKTRIIKEEYFKIITDDSHPLFNEAIRFAKTFRNHYEAFSEGMSKVFDYRGYKIVFDTDLLDSSTDHLLDNGLNDLKDLLEQIKLDGLENIGDAKNKEKLKSAIYSISKVKNNWKEDIQQLSFVVSKVAKKVKFNSEVSGSTLETNYLEPAGRSYVFNQETLDMLNDLETTIYEYCFQVYFSFVSKVSDEIAKKMKEASKFTFFDFLYYLTEKFKESSATKNRELVKHVYDRHNHILIDESQDTNPMQTQLFFYLTGLTSTDDWELVEPQPGSLFIVGDPKQSIYSFRGADVKAYNHVKEVFSNFGKVIMLSKNFRSNVEVKEYFNDVMNDVLRIGNEPLVHPDIPLDPSTPKEIERIKAEQNKDITLNGVYTYQTSNHKKEDAVNVANIVKQIVDNKNYKIIAKKSNKVRTIQYQDILIITRGTKIPEYIKEFAKNKIPLRVEAKIYFSNCPAVDILKKLVYLLFEPHQKKYFVDVVTSDLYKLKTTDIIEMKKDGFDLNISSILDEEGNGIKLTNQNHQTIVCELNKLYLATKGMTVSSTLFYLLTNNEFQFFKNISSDFLDYAYFMIELVKAAEKEGTIISFDDAKSFLERTISDDSDIERVMKFSKEVNQVKISNLHKVKGLQAPIIILAAPSTENHNSTMYADRDNKLLYFSEMSVSNSFNGKTTICKSEKYQDQMIKANNDSDAEERRVEYVAATRAESVLIIGKPNKIDSDCRNPWNELLPSEPRPIPDYPANQKEPVIEQFDDVMNEYHSIVNNDCNNASYSVYSPSNLRIRNLITNVDEVDEDEEKENKSELDIKRSLLGTLIHRLLECIVSSKNKFDINELSKKILEEQNLQDEELLNILVEVGNTFVSEGFKQTKDCVPQNLFEVLMKAEEVLCEVPFAYKSNTSIVSGIIDLLYKDQTGWHVIDYKTNMEGDISSLEEEYKGQLNVYIKAVKQATGLDCDAHIYHIETE